MAVAQLGNVEVLDIDWEMGWASVEVLRRLRLAFLWNGIETWDCVLGRTS